MEILGVDVGIRTCGYVLCKVRNLDIELIEEGEIKPNPSNPLPQKLNDIFDKLEDQIKRHKPIAVVVEKLYSHHRHPTTLGVLAQVKGIVALLAYKNKIGFYEYSPTRARKAFLGKGSADSSQVKRMAENITGKKFKSEHTADAFSLVTAHSHAQKFKRILIRSK